MAKLKEKTDAELRQLETQFRALGAKPETHNPKPDTPVLKIIRTQKYAQQPPKVVAVHPSVSNILNMLESEIQEAQRKIENNKRSIHILKIAEIARNGENISAPSTLVNENRAITIEQPPIPITQNP